MVTGLTLTRELFVPRELIFQAWTEADHLSGWYAPAGGFAREVSVDARPGGEYLLAWTDDAGIRYVQRGVFHVVDRPAGFRCTQWLEGGFSEHYATQVVVSMAETGGSSRIEIRQEGFPSVVAREAQKLLWEALLDQLEAYFSAI
jgi:uncharacterized protein YndB with AHSA1/START domain